MLRTGQSPAPHGGGLPPLRPRDLARRRECRYRGPWRLPGPDSHRLAAVSLSLGYVVVASLPWSSAPELLDAHSAGIATRSTDQPVNVTCWHQPAYVSPQRKPHSSPHSRLTLRAPT